MTGVESTWGGGAFTPLYWCLVHRARAVFLARLFFLGSGMDIACFGVGLFALALGM